MGKGDDALRIVNSVATLKKRGNEYQGCAPYRNGDNPTAFTIELTDGGAGIKWYDFVDGKGGGLSALAELMPELAPLVLYRSAGGGLPDVSHVDMSEPPPELEDNAPPMTVVTAPPKSGAGAYATLATYAADHGVSEQVFIKAGVTMITHNGAPWLSFPMSADPNNPRLRRLDGGSPKWKPAKTGATPCLYGLEPALAIAKMYNTKHLVICNGQPSVVVAQHFDIPAFCVTDGEGKPIPNAIVSLIKETLTAGGWSLWIAADNDDAGRNRAKAVYELFHAHTPQVIQWDGKTDGYDLADHCKEHGDPSRDKLKDYIVHIGLNTQTQLLKEMSASMRQLTRNNSPEQAEAAQLLVSQLQTQLDVLTRSQVTDCIMDAKAVSVAAIQFNERVVQVKDNPQGTMGLRSSILELDVALGGFIPGANYLFLAETGTGKTQLMASFANGFAKQSPGLIVSMESPYVEFVNRMVAYRVKLPFGDIRRAQHRYKDENGQLHIKPFIPAEIDKVRRHYGELAALERQRRVIYTRPGSFSPNGLMAIAKRAKEDFGIEWMIIDSLNNIMSPGMEDRERLTLAAQASESIAVSQNIVVVATAQGGRSAKGRQDKRLGLHDARGSSQIEDKAFFHGSIVNYWGLVWRGEMKKSEVDTSVYPYGSAHLKINKLRDGAVENGMVITQCIGGCGFYDWPRPKRQ